MGNIKKYHCQDFENLAFKNSEMEIVERLFGDIGVELTSLYVQGEIVKGDEMSVSIVGSRRMTEYGRRACRYIVGELCRYGITIVSGLMYGVDLEAHAAAIENGGRTIGVLGYGFDHLPKYRYAQNMASKIIKERRGAIVSQFESSFPAADWTFPRRNKIVANLSKATIVIEAGEKSGTLITAGFAADIGKEVFVVPGSIFSSNSIGCHALISMGAKILPHPKDVVEYLGLSIAKNRLLQNIDSLSENEKLVIQALRSASETVSVFSRDKIWNIVKSHDKMSSLEANEFTGILTALELKGIIKSKLKGYEISYS